MTARSKSLGGCRCNQRIPGGTRCLPVLLALGCRGEVVNVRPPILVSTNLVKDNISARIILRAGETPESLANAGCRHLNATGAGCTHADQTAIQEELKNLLVQFTDLNAGEQIMQQIRFGWNLLLSHRNAEEARLHFVSAMAKFPDSPFLLKEFAAAAVLTHVLPRWGDDGYMLYQADQSGNWAHIIEPKSTFYAMTLDTWETFAAIRYRTPRGFLSEEEPELLAAGMPAHAFVPVVDVQGIDGNAFLGGLVYEHRIQHDLKVFKLLESKGLLRPKVALQAGDAYTRVLRSATRVREGIMELTAEQWHSIYPYHNRRFYIHPCQRLVQALNPASALETRLLQSSSQKVTSRAGGFLSAGGVLVIDNLLTPEAMMHLRDFAELSTVWYQERPNSLGAGLSTGFSPQLLAQVAEELKILLADVLCDLPLTNVWAFKFGDDSGTDLRADQAAVNVHLWLSPDGINQNESAGRITIYDATTDVEPLPVEGGTGSMLEELVRQRDGKNISVPSRQNRAVVFDSARIHAEKSSIRRSEGNNFESFEYQISVSLLFGLKGLYCAQRRSAKLMFEDEVTRLAEGSTSNG
eukprot:s968_g11.t1